MNEKEIGVDKTLYEQQESKLSEQSAAFIELLTKRGILEDARIDDDRIRQAKKEKKKNMYYGRVVLLVPVYQGGRISQPCSGGMDVRPYQCR